MKSFRPFADFFAIFLLCGSAWAQAQEALTARPLSDPPNAVFRQITPDGRVVYSDKVLPGARVDHTLEVDTKTNGDLWSVQGGPRPDIPTQVERTPVKQVSSIPPPGKRKTVEEATSDVIRAEMRLEDALREQKSEADVAQAKAVLKRAIAERETLRKGGRERP